MSSAAVATGSPLWSLAVWEEDREEEGVLPTIWIQGQSVRWPRGTKTERKMADMVAPDDSWETFPLVKVKFQSDSKKECEAQYDLTTTVESSEEDHCDETSLETRKRKHTKKDWGNDFVTDIDGFRRRRKGPIDENSPNSAQASLHVSYKEQPNCSQSNEHDGSQVEKQAERRKLPTPPPKRKETPNHHGFELEIPADDQHAAGSSMSKRHDGSQVEKQAERRKLPTPPPKRKETPNHHGFELEIPADDQHAAGSSMSKRHEGSQVEKQSHRRKLSTPPLKRTEKHDISIRKEARQSSTDRRENRGQSNFWQAIQAFGERRSRDKRKQIISESESLSSADEEEVRSKHKKARRSKTRDRSPSRKISQSGKKDLFPMDEGRFQRKVLYLLTEIRDSLKHTGKVTVEQDRGLQIKQLSTLDDLREFEQFLDEGDNLEKLKFTFKRIGGNSAAEQIKRIMEKTMTNGLQSLMNRTGKNKKFPFASTHTYSALKEAVLEQWGDNVSLSKLENRVQAVLKFAPYRTGGDKLVKEKETELNRTNEDVQNSESD